MQQQIEVSWILFQKLILKNNMQNTKQRFLYEVQITWAFFYLLNI